VENTLGIIVNMMDPRLRASPRHGGQEFFFDSAPIRRGGVPSGAAAVTGEWNKNI